TEFFKADAYLQTQGTLAQPTAATFTGKVIAIDTNTSDILRRGELIGGDASVTVTVSGGTTSAAVSLTNLEATTFTTGSPLVPISYANQTWSALTVTTGAFGSTTSTRKINGSFRKQNNDGDSNTDIVDTVGAVFEITGPTQSGNFTGGFVATQ
ncbi:MAG: hypothetical protein OXC42_03100, partial [Gammaproteobacteria bacterium]|nr:hypothetical protein [Gammaproteobacteria bacterium]